MKTSPVPVVALAILSFLASARAATMSANAVPPTKLADDISNIPDLPPGATTGLDKWWPGSSTAFGNPGMTVGQTFTTGNGALLLKAVTFRVHDATQPSKIYTLRVGTVSGSTFATIASETATQSIATAVGDYWTWTFDTPVLLSPNTRYGVDVGINSSTSGWNTGIPYVYFTTADTYSGGTRFRSGSAGDGIGNNSISQTSGDRIFHLALERPLGETFELVATSPADGETGVQATRNLVLTFSQDIAPGSGNIVIRNLSDPTDTPIPAADPRLSYEHNVLTLDATGLLAWSTDYAIRIDGAAILGNGGANFAGIDDDTTWNFTTGGGDPLLDAIAGLKAHINGTAPLTAAQLEQASLALKAQIDRFAESATTIAAVFDLVGTYDSVKGALFVGTATGGLTRSAETNDLTWTIYRTMQSIMDKIYNAPTLAAHEALLGGFKFGSAANFPGPCAPPADPNLARTVPIQGSFEDTFGRDTQGWTQPARKPTGCYLAPGTVATVTVPPALVNHGYQVRVGAHSWDLSNRPSIRRLDRATLLYPVNATTIKVASPYGGGIYLEVPFRASAGVVDVTITGAVRSPYFSAKSFHQTTPAEWLVERAHGAPWADFQSDKFMTQVPAKWIYAHPDPVKLMQDWDKAMDAINDLMGFPHLRGKETMYPQVDIIMRASVHAPGYPAVNVTDNPNTERGGYHNNYIVRGPGASSTAAHIEFHEQGHAFFFPKFGGETEANVNLPHVAMLHRMFGYDLDTAFRSSLGSSRAYQTLDTTAMAWMCVFNFAPRRVPMATAEKAYQLKGHAKFVDIARLYGWDGLGTYWRSFMEDDANSVSYSTSTDALLLRLCKSVGKDIRPLFHFWGIHPGNPANLAALIAAAGLQPAPEIYHRLVHYQSLVPANNSAFRTFAQNWWGKQPSISGYWEEREHSRQWDTTPLYGEGDQQRSEATNPGEIYNENSATDIRNRVQELIDLYFPAGITPDPMGFATVPQAIDATTIGMTATTASAAVGPVEYYFENTTTGATRDWDASPVWNQTGLGSGQTYSYRVKARNGLGEETAWSSALSATLAPTGTPFELWAEGFAGLTDSDPALDFDAGGLPTGIEWVLGGDPTAGGDDAAIAPTLDNESDPDGKLLFVFRRSHDANTDGKTTIAVQYGSDLAGWTTAVHQGNGPGDITITAEPNGFAPGLDRVTVALPPGFAESGSLFVRLSVLVTP